MSYTWAGGSTTAWRKVRALVLARDNHQCQLRLPGEWVTARGRKQRCQGVATHVHHTVGRAVSGDDPAYLVAACAPCNMRVGEPGRHDPAPAPRTRW